MTRPLPEKTATAAPVLDAIRRLWWLHAVADGRGKPRPAGDPGGGQYRGAVASRRSARKAASAVIDIMRRIVDGEETLDILCLEGSVMRGPNGTGRFPHDVGYRPSGDGLDRGSRGKGRPRGGGGKLRGLSAASRLRARTRSKPAALPMKASAPAGCSDRISAPEIRHACDQCRRLSDSSGLADRDTAHDRRRALRQGRYRRMGAAALLHHASRPSRLCAQRVLRVQGECGEALRSRLHDGKSRLQGHAGARRLQHARLERRRIVPRRWLPLHQLHGAGLRGAGAFLRPDAEDFRYPGRAADRHAESVVRGACLAVEGGDAAAADGKTLSPTT